MSDHPLDSDDFTTRYRALRDDIAKKSALRPKADNQGRRIGPVVLYEHDSHGMLIGAVEQPAPTVPVAAEAEPTGPQMPRPNVAQGTSGSVHNTTEALMQA